MKGRVSKENSQGHSGGGLKTSCTGLGGAGQRVFNDVSRGCGFLLPSDQIYGAQAVPIFAEEGFSKSRVVALLYGIACVRLPWGIRAYSITGDSKSGQIVHGKHRQKRRKDRRPI